MQDLKKKTHSGDSITQSDTCQMQIWRCETPSVTVTTEGLNRRKCAFPDHLPPMSNLISGDEPAAKLSNHVDFPSPPPCLPVVNGTNVS